jgi:hypothetical protein
MLTFPPGKLPRGRPEGTILGYSPYRLEKGQPRDPVRTEIRYTEEDRDEVVRRPTTQQESQDIGLDIQELYTRRIAEVWRISPAS